MSALLQHGFSCRVCSGTRTLACNYVCVFNALLTHCCYCNKSATSAARVRLRQPVLQRALSDLYSLHHITAVTDVSPEAKELLPHSLSLYIYLLLQRSGRTPGFSGSASTLVVTERTRGSA